MAQLVEYDLAKVGVAGSSPVSRSYFLPRKIKGFRNCGELFFCLHKIELPLLLWLLFVGWTPGMRLGRVVQR